MNTLVTIVIVLPVAFFAGTLVATLTTLFTRTEDEYTFWHLAFLYAALFLLLVWVFMGPYPLGGE